jgi:hypothetical protein
MKQFQLDTQELVAELQRIDVSEVAPDRQREASVGPLPN